MAQRLYTAPQPTAGRTALGRVAGRPRRGRASAPAAAYATLSVLALIVLIPFLWLISTSLQGNDALFQTPPQLIPAPPQREPPM